MIKKPEGDLITVCFRKIILAAGQGLDLRGKLQAGGVLRGVAVSLEGDKGWRC